MLYRGETTQVPPVYSVEKEKITIPNLIFEKELVLSEGKYLLSLTSEDTTGIEVDNYKYEVEYTFVDRDVQTPHQSDWHITPQIKKKGV